MPHFIMQGAIKENKMHSKKGGGKVIYRYEEY